MPLPFARHFLILVQVTCTVAVVAQEETATSESTESQVFIPPKPYPVERYETGWNTNPFTLKTAAPAVQKESFAKDLALANMSEINGEQIVVLMNAKTRERIRLTSANRDPNGINIKSVHIANSLKDSYAEVEKGGEVAVLKYDESLQKQLVAQAQTQNPNVRAAAKPLGSPRPPESAQGRGTSANAGAITRVPATGLNARAGTARPAAMTPPERNSVPPPMRRRLLTVPRASSSSPQPNSAPTQVPAPSN